ncbi:MAG: hypothetical protein MUO31_10490, partial [Thermodesulfovibrionales bacterium]|nr:hypothetical protein [Thermodesulfovibrionales bacterium]
PGNGCPTEDLGHDGEGKESVNTTMRQLIATERSFPIFLGYPIVCARMIFWSALSFIAFAKASLSIDPLRIDDSER